MTLTNLRKLELETGREAAWTEAMDDETMARIALQESEDPDWAEKEYREFLAGEFAVMDPAYVL